jgi:hypothetical protein
MFFSFASASIPQGCKGQGIEEVEQAAAAHRTAAQIRKTGRNLNGIPLAGMSITSSPKRIERMFSQVKGLNDRRRDIFPPSTR